MAWRETAERERPAREVRPAHDEFISRNKNWPMRSWSSGFSTPSTDGPPALKRWGGIITGFACTYSKALNASRAAVIDAVDGTGHVDPLVLVNGHRGTDHAGESTNRVRAAKHSECDGVDRVFIAVTPSQFEALAEAVGAEVHVP